MTDKDIRDMLENAYVLPTSDNERIFIRRYERRTLRLLDVIKLEFRYMGLPSILVGVMLCFLCVLVIKMEDPETMWIVSAMIPFIAVIPMVLLSKSERYHMDEMEASSRFSLRFMRVVRLGIVGVFTFGSFLSIGLIMKTQSVFTFIDYLVYVSTPYLVSDFGAMLITRRWHGKEDIYGVLGVCMLSSLIPFLVKMFRVNGFLSDSAILVMEAFLILSVVSECVKYVKESENVSWNLY